MSRRDLAEALRRDDLWLAGGAGRFTLLDTVAVSRCPSRDPEVLLVEFEDGQPCVAELMAGEDTPRDPAEDESDACDLCDGAGCRVCLAVPGWNG